MAKYLIKTIKLYDSKSGDWCQESDWMYVDSDKINAVEIFGKRFVAEEKTDAPTIEVETQKAYEQGAKDALDQYDEICRIVSEIRMAVGCKTAKECWELIKNGEIQRVKHGQWETYPIADDCWQCSVCGTLRMGSQSNYCPNCGAKMDLDEVEK